MLTTEPPWQGTQRKGLTTRNTHVKYESSITYKCRELKITKLKIFNV